MPKRSNPFQNLFHLIYRQMADSATVTESKMLRDQETGEEREVDIVIEAAAVGERVVIGVECIDRSRPAGVEWVEQMRAKHQALLTSKVVLVSRSGFYKSALKKAERYGFSTIALGDAMAADWTRIVGKAESMQYEYFDNTARYTLLLDNGDGSLLPWAPPNDRLVRVNDGNLVSINQIVNEIVASPQLRKVVLDRLDAGNDPRILITYKPHTVWHAIDDIGQSREIVRIEIVLETAKETTPMSLIHGAVGDKLVAYGEAVNSHGKTMLAVIERMGEPGVAGIRFPSGEFQIRPLKDS